MVVAYIIAESEAEYQSEAEATKDTPYLALMGKLRGVFREYFGKKLTAL